MDKQVLQLVVLEYRQLQQSSRQEVVHCGNRGTSYTEC